VNILAALLAGGVSSFKGIHDLVVQGLPPRGEFTMTAEEFDVKMCRLKRQEPFQPFVVELLDGNSILVTKPSLAITIGGAIYWSPEDELIDILADQVRSIHLATGEVVS
jgi:hypothetical protein